MIRTFDMTRTILAVLAVLTAMSVAAAPRVDTIEPSSGAVTGGTYVLISGSDLTGFALGCPALDCANYAQFGGELGTLIASDDTQWVVRTPPHAAGSVDVVVNVAGKGKITISGGFRYVEPADGDLVRLLIPIASSGPGAFGSQWRSDVTMHNASEEIVYPQGPTCNPFILAPCLQVRIGPHQTIHLTLYPASGTPGAFVRIPRRLANAIDVQSRVQDVSRQAETWGTAIPVVHETDFRPVVRLHAVPADARFRDTLRIYGYLRGGSAKVRIIDEANNAVIASTELTLPEPQDRTSYPPFAQIGSLRDTFPQIAAFENVGVEVESELVWAFIGVTNNETQHVTIIAPE